MKKLLLFSLGCLFAFSSCTRFTETGSDFGYFYVKQKVDGKKLLGVVCKSDVDVWFSLGRHSYGQLLIPYDQIGNQPVYGGIPCQYDRIEYDSDRMPMFICFRDGDGYYFDIYGHKLAAGNKVSCVEFLGKGDKYCFGNDWEYMFYTPQGVYALDFGPCEDFMLGTTGYAVQKNGLWGFFRGCSAQTAEQLYDYRYDEIIEVIAKDGYSPNLYLARQGENWKALNSMKEPVPLNRQWLRRVLEFKEQNTGLPFFSMTYR